MNFDTVEDMLLFCAVLSKLAYQDVLDLSIVKDELLQEHLEIFNDPNTVKLSIKQRGWFMYDSTQRIAYIAFRGTASREHGLLNLHFVTRAIDSSNKKIRVHAGFYRYYKHIRKDIFDLLELVKSEGDTPNTKLKIVLTGHSLGGAAAMICALDLIINNHVDPDQLTCMTFGAPMVGNDSFCDFYSKYVQNSFHINCGVDITPRIPIPGLQHVDSTIMIPMRKTSMFDYVNHHSMENHLKAIRERVPWYRHVTRRMGTPPSNHMKRCIHTRHTKSPAAITMKNISCLLAF